MLRMLTFPLCLLIAVSVASAADKEYRRPNLIFIMADDMGRDWVSCYGSHHKTPNIDALAAKGLRFEIAWSSPICTPTRLQLLTGKYPFRTGWTDHHDVPRWGGAGFDPDKLVCFARPIRKEGYATAIAGKWQVNDLRKQPDILKQHGFDEHCVWPGYETGNAASYERYWDGYYVTNGKRETHKGRFGPDVINDFAVDFIKRHKNKPFLLYYPMVLPHGPLVETPLNKDKSPPKSEQYAGMVTYVDHLVGRVVKTVDDLGLADDTVIIFTGDNGSPTSGSVDGLKIPKGKGNIADYGMRVPFIVRGPQNMPEKIRGTSTDRLIDFTDVYPTLCHFAGIETPDSMGLDGESMIGQLLTGDVQLDFPREWIYGQRGGRRAVRDKQYKLDDSGAFWDIAADPTQQNDLRNSDKTEHIEARRRLQAVLDAMPKDADAPFDEFRPSARKSKRR